MQRRVLFALSVLVRSLPVCLCSVPDRPRPFNVQLFRWSKSTSCFVNVEVWHHVRQFSVQLDAG